MTFISGDMALFEASDRVISSFALDVTYSMSMWQHLIKRRFNWIAFNLSRSSSSYNGWDLKRPMDTSTYRIRPMKIKRMKRNDASLQTRDVAASQRSIKDWTNMT